MGLLNCLRVMKCSFLFYPCLNNDYNILFWLREGHYGKQGQKILHVEEGLQPGIEALVGDLLPKLSQLRPGDRIRCNPSPASQRVEQLAREFLRILHS